MDCLSPEHQYKVTNQTLLTHTDKIHALQTALGNHRSKSDIFLPDDDFYRKINGIEDVERMADSVFRWLGIKHKSLIFYIDSSQKEPLIFDKSHGHSSAKIGVNALNDPLYCGALIAHAIIHHLLVGRHKLILRSTSENELLTDLGTIYAGLGIIVLNGLEGRNKPLGALAENNYISEFIDYVNNHQIVSTVWQPYVLPAVIEEFTNVETDIIRPGFVAALQAKRRKLKLKYLAYASFIIAMLSMAAFYMMSRPDYSSFELAEHRDSLNILKSQHSHCQQTIKYKQSHWDTSDIFIMRQIEADQTRCNSLKNRYNYELNLYKSKVKP